MYRDVLYGDETYREITYRDVSSLYPKKAQDEYHARRKSIFLEAERRKKIWFSDRNINI